MAEGCDWKCGICLSFVFTEPKLLNCYHTFCLPCLQRLDINDNKIICPLCTTSIALPDDGVIGLKPYPYKLKYVKEGKEVLDVCDLCDDQNFAVSKCLDCKTNLCSNCRDYHGKLKTSKNHVIRSLKILESEKLDQTEATIKTKCKEHSKELTLFCRPCNTLLCFDCSEEIHPCHQVENLSSILQNKKEMLLVRIASFKARISFLQNTAEMVKLKEVNYNKHCLVLKHNVKERATNLKDRFCSAVDELTKKNLDIIDDIKKKDIEKLDKYMNQIETDKMSLSGLIMTTENYVNQSSDTHFLEEFSVIGKRLDETLRKSVNIFPSIHDLNYEWDDVSPVVIEKIFGEITATEKEKEVKPMYPHLPVPELSLLPAHKVVKRSEFVVSNEVLDIIPTNNDNAWLLTAGMACRYSSKGIKDESIDTHPDIKHFVHKSASRMLFWYENSVVKNNKSIYSRFCTVPFRNGLPCCLSRNGNLFVYSPTEKIFYELRRDKEYSSACIQNKFELKDPNNILQQGSTFTGERIVMKQLQNFNFVISFSKDVIVFADKNFIVLDSFQKPYALFKSLATDNYGNTLVADYVSDMIYVISENRVFKQTLMKL